MYLHGDKEIIDFTHPSIWLIPSIEEEVEVEEDVNGFKKNKWIDQMEDLGRGFSCSNGIEVQQVPNRQITT